jgi:type I restriction enzyme S subunit
MAAFLAAKLGDCVDLLAGFAFKSERFTDKADDIALVKGENVSQGHILWDISKRWPEAEWSAFEKYHLRTGDVVVAMDRPWVPAGLKWAYIRSDAPRALLVQRCSRLRSNTPKLDQGFLRFVIGGPGFESYVKPITTGVNVPHISGRQILDYEFLLPPISIQRRIASILSAYDDLIENSQRRIKILESMARALYREWFVQFRFPGHENHPRVASPLGEIPEGWEVKEMQDVAEVVDCLHSRKPSEYESGPGILLQLNNIGEGGKLDMSKVFRISADDYRLWTSRIELRQGDCVVTNVGRVGAVAQIPAGVKVAPGRNMTAIRARPEKLTPTFLIEYLLSSHMESEVAKKKDLGTIMDSLNVKGIVRLNVPCPSFATMERYEEIARPIRQRIELLVEQISSLRRTRDLLLPRLLSGQIALDELEAA